MKKFLSFQLLFVCCALIGAQTTDTTYTDIEMHGSVVGKTGQSIVGAYVSLASAPYLTVVTDQNAQFSIVGKKMNIVSIRYRGSMQKTSEPGIQMNGNRLYIASSPGAPVTVSLFSMDGCRLLSRTVEKDGATARKLLLPTVAQGLYLLNVTTASEGMIFKRMFTAGQELSVVCGSSPRAASYITSAASAPISDTIIVVADGYLPLYLPITDYTTPLTQIKMETTVNQWLPVTGSLEHEGSMVKIKASGFSFGMGQPVIIKDDASKWNREQPVNTVSFTYDYWMDTTEVNQQLYDSVMKSVPQYTTPSGWITKYGVGPTIAAHHSGPGDAMLFCNARSKLENLDTVYTYDTILGRPGGMCSLRNFKTDCTKNGYRLPTEAEWEYACRGGTVSDFYWNKMYRPYPATPEDTAEIDQYALWYHNCGCKPTDGNEYALKPGVASKKPNNYGLYDMIGACVEYIHLLSIKYPAAGAIDPKPSLPSDTVLSYRGGNFSNDPVYLRSSSRLFKWGDYYYCFLGFRTVKEVR